MPEYQKKETKEQKPAAVYFKSLTIRDVKCFRGKHTIDLSDGEGRPAQWTVILGNNNTGKTTILKCLAGLEANIGEVMIAGEDLHEDEPGIIEVSKPSFDFIHEDMFGIKKSSVVQSELYRCSLFRRENFLSGNQFDEFEWKWGRGSDATYLESDFAQQLIIEAYGASRKMDENGSNILPRLASLLINANLFNAEDWLVKLYYAHLEKQSQASFIFEKASQILMGGLLPDVKKVKVGREQKGQSFSHFLEFLTDFGWIRLRDLDYGYQTMLAWVLDLVRRMFERYPDSPNPIREPAIVLVDEIDLHLHPEWQRKIIAHLTKYFPNTQFIVTAHSPLVVQSAEKINLVLLEKEGDHVNIRQPNIPTYQGWSLEEILSDLMGLEDRTHSQAYLDILKDFDAALELDDFEKAKSAHDRIAKIVHPSSNLPKLMRLRMSSLVPA